MALPPPSTPILEALDWMLSAGQLTQAEYTFLTSPIPCAVWTYGDLPVVTERNEIKDKVLAGKLKKTFGIVEAPTPKAEAGPKIEPSVTRFGEPAQG